MSKYRAKLDKDSCGVLFYKKGKEYWLPISLPAIELFDIQEQQIKKLKEEQLRKDKLFEQHKDNSWKLVEQIKVKNIALKEAIEVLKEHGFHKKSSTICLIKQALKK